MGEIGIPFEPYRGDRPYIFISYAHLDSDIVFPEIQRLHDLKYRVWYDENIGPGNEWSDDISGAIDHCSFFIVFVTPRSVDRLIVRNEILYALEHEKPILPVFLEPTTLPGNIGILVKHLNGINKYEHTKSQYYRLLEHAIPAYLQGPGLYTEPGIPAGTDIQTPLVSFHESHVQGYLPLQVDEVSARHTSGAILKTARLIRNACLLIAVCMVFAAWICLALDLTGIPVLLLELGGVIALFSLVLYGIYSGVKPTGLNEFIRAERYRFLQFRQFVSPDDEPGLLEIKKKIREQTPYTMEEWLNGESLDENPRYIQMRRNYQGILDLVNFYVQERLTPQIRHSSNAIAGLKRCSATTGIAPGGMFLVILALISLYIYFDISQIATKEMAIMSAIRYLLIIVLLGLTYSILLSATTLFVGSPDAIRNYLALEISKKDSLESAERDLRALALRLGNQSSAEVVPAAGPGKDYEYEVFRIILETEDILEIHLRH